MYTCKYKYCRFYCLTSLRPTGMDKILINQDDQITVTNDELL